MAVNGVFRCFVHLWVVAQAQVIVRAEIQDLGTVIQGDFHVLRSGNDPLFLEQTGRFNLRQFVAKVLFHRSVHRGKSFGFTSRN